ncbi:MAG: LysR substrate-binding domain-containing protein [Pseudomonadota bacterium]
MARAGRGVAWLPASLAAEDLRSGRLVRAGGSDWEVPVAIRLTRPRARQSPAAEALWARLA